VHTWKISSYCKWFMMHWSLPCVSQSYSTRGSNSKQIMFYDYIGRQLFLELHLIHILIQCLISNINHHAYGIQSLIFVSFIVYTNQFFHTWIWFFNLTIYIFCCITFYFIYNLTMNGCAFHVQAGCNTK
jgi:hypothetical protein